MIFAAVLRLLDRCSAQLYTGSVEQCTNLMASYSPLEDSAGRLGLPVAELNDFVLKAWIASVSKDGRRYISDRDEYKIRFILHLRHALRLSDDQIGQVLSSQNPPYDLSKVEAALEERWGEREIADQR